MQILLTNDDGYQAEGLLALADALSQIAQVTVVAPAEGCSCCGHSVTTHRAIKHFKHSKDAYVVEGWPADCVRVGLLHLALDPDWVISGINHGGNLGTDIWMSGTVAAAREAAFLGSPSIAVSQYRRQELSLEWSTSAARAVTIFQRLAQQSRSELGVWNVNLPALDDHVDLPMPAFCDPELQCFPFQFEPLEEGLVYRTNYHARPRKEGSDVFHCFSGTPSISWLSLNSR
jgi:5'-nucleotidase